MSLNVGKEVAALLRMTVKELRIRYAEAFGDVTHANNKAWLVKRIAGVCRRERRATCPNGRVAKPPSWPTTPICGCRRRGQRSGNRRPTRATEGRLEL